MALKPMALNTPEAIAAAYDGNKKKIADAARMGLIDPTAAVMAGMFIDRMRNAAAAEQRPTTTVADDVLGAAQMPAGVAAIPQQAPGAGVAALPSGIKEMAGGGIVAFDEGGEVPGYAGGAYLDSRNDPAMRIDPKVQRQRDDVRLQILLQELKEEEAKGNKANVDALRREIRTIKPAPSAEGGLYNLFPSAQARPAIVVDPMQSREEGGVRTIAPMIGPAQQTVSQQFPLSTENELLARRQEGVGYRQEPSIPPAPTVSAMEVPEKAPVIPEAPTPVYGAKLPALAKLEPELLKEERMPTPEETMAAKRAARKAAGVDDEYYSKKREAITKEREGAQGEFEKDKWLAAAQMFAEIAAGTSPNALANIGSGMAKGIPGFAQVRKDMKEKEKLLREREDRVDDLEQTRRMGDADAIYGAEEKVKDLNNQIKLYNNKITNTAKEAFWKGTNEFAALAFQQYKLDERQQNELRQRAWEVGANNQAQWLRLAAEVAARKDIAETRAKGMETYRQSQLEAKAAELRGNVKAEMEAGIRKQLKEKYGSNANIDAEVNKQLEAEVQRRLKGFATLGGADSYSGWNLLPD